MKQQSKPQANKQSRQPQSTASHQAPVHFGKHECKAAPKGGWTMSKYSNV